MTELLTGINIQYPISQLIVAGKKTIETRTYPIPKHYIGQTLLLVETPGKCGKFKSRAIARITFGESFRYSSSKEFYGHTKYHCVTPDSPWAWNGKDEKWGWQIKNIERLTSPVVITKRLGIKFTKEIPLTEAT